MKLSKQQRMERSRATAKAVRAALRAHFTGIGAKGRMVRFVGASLVTSAGWFAKLVCLASWAAVAAVLVGPEHATALAQFHAWMVATPLAQVAARSEWMVWSVASELVKFSLILGLGQELIRLIKPAANAAKQRFMQAAV